MSGCKTDRYSLNSCHGPVRVAFLIMPIRTSSLDASDQRSADSGRVSCSCLRWWPDLIVWPSSPLSRLRRTTIVLVVVRVVRGVNREFQARTAVEPASLRVMGVEPSDPVFPHAPTPFSDRLAGAINKAHSASCASAVVGHCAGTSWRGPNIPRLVYFGLRISA